MTHGAMYIITVHNGKTTNIIGYQDGRIGVRKLWRVHFGYSTTKVMDHEGILVFSNHEAPRNLQAP